jgi:predicted RNase H-like HicB family nuclease
MRNYIGLIHKEAASDFGVSFPDFPGVVTAGRSLDDARLAEEALAFQIEGMVADGEAIPEPSRLEEVMADPENKDGVVVLVGVKTDTRKAVRVNVTFTEHTLEQIDQFAEAHGYTRSGFLARAAKHAMEQPEQKTTPRAAPRSQKTGVIRLSASAAKAGHKTSPKSRRKARLAASLKVAGRRRRHGKLRG